MARLRELTLNTEERKGGDCYGDFIGLQMFPGKGSPQQELF